MCAVNSIYFPVGIFLSGIALVSICIWPLVTYSDQARTWKDTNCTTIKSSVNAVKINCSCECGCSGTVYNFPNCTDPNKFRGVIKSDMCSTKRCDTCVYGFANCKRCQYYQFRISLFFKYFNPKTKIWYYYTIRKNINDDEVAALKWIKERSDNFPCSYSTNNPFLMPVFGSLEKDGVIAIKVISSLMSVLFAGTLLVILFWCVYRKRRNYQQF